jgi:hypothetical protein
MTAWRAARLDPTDAAQPGSAATAAQIATRAGM